MVVECPKSPSGKHQFVRGYECIWCGTIGGRPEELEALRERIKTLEEQVKQISEEDLQRLLKEADIRNLTDREFLDLLEGYLRRKRPTEIPSLAPLFKRESKQAPTELMRQLYSDVERELSHALQPGIGYRELVEHIRRARDNLRGIMRKMGWKGAF